MLISTLPGDELGNFVRNSTAKGSYVLVFFWRVTLGMWQAGKEKKRSFGLIFRETYIYLFRVIFGLNLYNNAFSNIVLKNIVV